MNKHNAPPDVIVLNGVSKRFGRVQAVRELTLRLPRRQTLALLGPSGCGKTTALRLIAGLDAPTNGAIWLDGRLVADGESFVPPEHRSVGLVFQDYALFPHLTVGGNVGFGLTRLPATERRSRIAALLALVDLGALADRYPHQLSGGQQQRVALARALATQPAVVLMDEPFSNLDAALRRRLREDVGAALRQVAATTLFVTHDQEEAFSIADEVAVMLEGQIVQRGTPQTIYTQPVSRAVAAFVGDANWIAGEAAGSVVTCAIGTLPLATSAHGPVTVLIRPEQLRMQPDTHGRGVVQRVSYFGHDQVARVCIADQLLLDARLVGQADLRVGTTVSVAVTSPVMAYKPSD
jgi:iron(III) transport system ATP-binding protein